MKKEGACLFVSRYHILPSGLKRKKMRMLTIALPRICAGLIGNRLTTNICIREQHGFDSEQLSEGNNLLYGGHSLYTLQYTVNSPYTDVYAWQAHPLVRL